MMVTDLSGYVNWEQSEKENGDERDVYSFWELKLLLHLPGLLGSYCTLRTSEGLGSSCRDGK